MRRVVADHIRHIVQYRTMLRDPDWRKRFLDLLDLDEGDEWDQEIIASIDEFIGNVACHELERLVRD